MSNFEYLMRLNTMSHRSANDLTQYPVFPWVLADYTSAQIDLDDPVKTFTISHGSCKSVDLSRSLPTHQHPRSPMGHANPLACLGPCRLIWRALQASYRDLSKPMGALHEPRRSRFVERYKDLAQVDDIPSFHYGSHYSSSAAVLYYLTRLEPFTKLSYELQVAETSDVLTSGRVE